jgi:DNA invertase Pin-like site-specific DNA recombinase
MAQREGWPVAGEFKDEAKSGYHGNRGDGLSQAQELAAALAAEHGDAVLLVQHSSRFARGDAVQAQHLVEVWLWALRAGVTLRSVEDDAMVQSLLTAVVAGDQNHAESKRKADAVSKGLRRRAAERGKLAGGPRPFGYRWHYELIDGRKVSSLELIPAEAEIVRRIFTDTINGCSQRAIARALQADAVPTASGKPWSQATITQILRNPLYVGRIRHGGEEFPGAHEAILDAQAWEAAVRIRESNVRRKGGRHPKGAHLLTRGLLRCGNCGYAMLPRTDPNRWGYEAYQCRGRLERGADFCDMPMIRRRVVDEALLAELKSRYLDLDGMRQRLAERQSSDLTVAEHALAEAEHQLAKADDALARIERDYIDGEITAQKWTRLEATLTGERDAAAAALSQAKERVETLRTSGALGDAEAAIMDRLAELKLAVADGIGNAPDLDALRTLLRDLFSAVELVSPSNPFGRGLDGILDVSEPSHPDPKVANGHRLLLHFRSEAFDVQAWRPRKVALPTVTTEREGFLTTSSPPRSSSRIR